MGYGRENKDVTVEVARPQEPRLMDEVRRRIRLKHYSLRTEQAHGDGYGGSSSPMAGGIRARSGWRRWSGS